MDVSDIVTPEKAEFVLTKSQQMLKVVFTALAGYAAEQAAGKIFVKTLASRAAKTAVHAITT